MKKMIFVAISFLAFQGLALAVSNGTFIPEACSQNRLTGRPAGPSLIRITGVCYGNISGVSNPKRFFVAYRSDGFNVVYQVASSKPSTSEAGAQDIELSGIGQVDANGAFSRFSSALSDSAILFSDTSGFPKALKAEGPLGQKQKNIRCASFDPKLAPAQLR